MVPGRDTALHSHPTDMLHPCILLPLRISLGLRPEHRHLQLLVHVVFTARSFGFLQIIGTFVKVLLSCALNNLLEEFVGLNLTELFLDGIQLLLLL